MARHLDNCNGLPSNHWFRIAVKCETVSSTFATDLGPHAMNSCLKVAVRVCNDIFHLADDTWSGKQTTNPYVGITTLQYNTNSANVRGWGSITHSILPAIPNFYHQTALCPLPHVQGVWALCSTWPLRLPMASLTTAR